MVFMDNDCLYPELESLKDKICVNVQNAFTILQLNVYRLATSRKIATPDQRNSQEEEAKNLPCHQGQRYVTIALSGCPKLGG